MDSDLLGQCLGCLGFMAQGLGLRGFGVNGLFRLSEYSDVPASGPKCHSDRSIWP